MRKVFEVELASENGCTELTLPATPYAMLDALDKLWLAEGEAPRWEILQSDAFPGVSLYLNQKGTLSELNALAQRLAELDEQELAIVEGLTLMEPGPQGEDIPLPRLIDLAYSSGCCHLVEGVVTDAKLGRFCAENGFVPEADDLSDAAFALLDFERIGKLFRETEGGEFTRGGYVQRYEELKQEYKTLDFSLKKPDYTMLAELPDGSRVKLPTPLGKTMAEEPAQCVDCAAPALNGLTGNLGTLYYLACRMAGLEADGGLPKYKALLESARCDDTILALRLADGLDQYSFSPNLRGPEAVAIDCLKTMLPNNEVELLTPYLNLFRYGEAVVNQCGGKLTSYGLIERTDGEPVQDMVCEHANNEMGMIQ